MLLWNKEIALKTTAVTHHEKNVDCIVSRHLIAPAKYSFIKLPVLKRMEK